MQGLVKGQQCCLPAMGVGLIVTGAGTEGTAVLFACYGC